MQHKLIAQKLFTGTEWLYYQEITIEDGIITSVLPLQDQSVLTTDTETFIAPAFIDFQVYGAGGKLFSAYPSAATLQTMHDVFSKEGTCLFQPTLATNTMAVFKEAIDAVKWYWQRGGKGVYGLHLEGPWINPDKRGAHIKELILKPTVDEVAALLGYGKDVIKTITMAPELCGDEVVDLILQHHIILSAGHSNATYTQATNSFEKGFAAVTHLYNAMSPLHHREPGLVGALLQHESIMASIIPDGHHVDFNAIAIAKKAMGSRLFAITDAVTETAIGPYQHYRSGDKYEADGTLSGSAISMKDAFKNLVEQVGIEVEEALRMCSLYPASVMNMEHLYGKIAPGFAAQLVVLNKQLNVVEVITA